MSNFILLHDIHFVIGGCTHRLFADSSTTIQQVIRKCLNSSIMQAENTPDRCIQISKKVSSSIYIAPFKSPYTTKCFTDAKMRNYVKINKLILSSIPGVHESRSRSKCQKLHMNPNLRTWKPAGDVKL